MSFLLEVLRWFGDPARWRGGRGIPYRVLEHMQLSVSATVIAVAIALPPAVYLAHRRRGEFLANALVNIGRAIPSFGVVVVAALFAIRSGTSLRFWPIVIALVLLALPPLFTNAYTGVAGVDPATVEVGRSMGMTEREVLVRVELPIAMPVILAGLRISFVQVVATATLGAIVSSGGGLGRYVIDGFATLAQGGRVEMFAGALLVAALVVVSEAALTLGERLLLPPGLRRMVETEEVAETAHPA